MLEAAASGLPRDVLVREIIRGAALERRYADDLPQRELDELNKALLAPLLEAPPDDVEELRSRLALAEFQTGAIPFRPSEMRLDGDGALAPLPLPGDDTFEAGIPESFNVLVKEMRSLGLNVDLHNSKQQRQGPETAEAAE